MNARLMTVLLIGTLIASCDRAPPPAPATPAVAPAPAAVDAQTLAHAEDIRAWRETRVENLRKPDGWLSLVGLHWIGEGEQSVGKAADRDIVVATGPDHLGVLTPAGNSVVELRLDPTIDNVRVQAYQNDAWVDVSAVGGIHRLRSDSSDAPSRILIGEDASILLIERGEKLGLRVKDANAKTRTGFTGIEYFDIDPSWRIEATWTPHAAPQTFEIQTVLGTVELMPNPGYASFTRDGKEYRLYPVLEEDGGDFFFIFADRTSGHETYGPGRFLYATPATAAGDKVLLDFNKAYNPPCAFSEYSTCPLPPPENRLDLRVTAGEKKYGNAAH